MNLGGIKRIRASHRVLFPVLATLLALVLVGGVALAATLITHQGSVTITESGGGGTPPPLTYDISVWDAATGGAPIVSGNSTFFALGDITKGYHVDRVVYIQVDGTATSAVVTLANNLATEGGTISYSPSSPVTVTKGTRSAVTVTYTAPNVVPNPATQSFNITYDAAAP